MHIYTLVEEVDKITYAYKGKRQLTNQQYVHIVCLIFKPGGR